jgi:hypothetical protein
MKSFRSFVIVILLNILTTMDFLIAPDGEVSRNYLYLAMLQSWCIRGANNFAHGIIFFISLSLLRLRKPDVSICWFIEGGISLAKPYQAYFLSAD